MITIKSILVTTHFSTASYSAMEYAAWLSKKERAAVTVLYSVDHFPPVAYHTVDLTFDKFWEEVLIVERERLEQFSNRFKKNFADPLKMVMTEGNAAQVIVQYAKENRIDIIVMSTHGRTGIQHMMLGSVAERVVRTAHCPVLTVKSVLHKASSSKKRLLQK